MLFIWNALITNFGYLISCLWGLGVNIQQNIKMSLLVNAIKNNDLNDIRSTLLNHHKVLHTNLEKVNQKSNNCVKIN